MKLKNEKFEVPSWIIRNLKNYNNCLIPQKIVKRQGIDEVVSALISKTGCNIEIKVTPGTPSTNKAGRKKKDVTYIAEVI